MPEQTISPGVFTEERDQSFLQQGVEEIGGAFVGPTEKGPAFTPVEVDSPQDYERQFGNQGLYMDYSTRNYLSDASTATVVRLLGEEGYESEAVEIQLPAGELSKTEFQIVRSNFDFSSGDTIDDDATINFSLCVAGRQERSTSDSAQTYDIEIEEYVDGEFHDTVFESADLEADCVIGDFDVSTGDFADVFYRVTVTLDDGQTDSIDSSTATVAGFWLAEVDYNWVDGASRGENELLSLQGRVENLDGGVYDYDIYEVINGNLQDTPVDSGVGLSDNTFEAFWEHNGEANENSDAAADTLNYIVEVEQGDITDVPDSISPAVDVFNRTDSNTFTFESFHINLDPGQNVDFGETVQVDLEASDSVDTVDVQETIDGTSATFSPSDLSSDTDDSSVYFEFTVGESGVGPVDTGDDVDYTITINDGGGNSDNETSDTYTIDGGVFQVDEVETDFSQGDEVGETELSGLRFTVTEDDGNAYDYDVIEILNGTDNGTAISGPITASGGTTEQFVELPTTGTGGDNLEYRVEVTQTSTQSGDIESNDEFTTAGQDVVSRTALGSFGIQNFDTNFTSGETVEFGDDIFGTFDVDLNGATDYDYDVIAVVNGTDQGSAVQNTGLTADSDFFNFAVGDSGIVEGTDINDGDTLKYRLEVIDDSSNTDNIESAELTFSGLPEQIFTFNEVDYSFDGGDNVEPGERLSVFFDIRRPSSSAYRYRVVEYQDGSSSGTTVADSTSEEGTEEITLDRVEVGWFNQATSDASTLEYELIVEVLDNNGNVTDSASQTSGTLNIETPNPSADTTLATLAPTQTLREDDDEIYDAQINPDSADITDFELILDKTAPMTSSVQDHEPDDEVEDLLNDSEIELNDSGPSLIDGKSYQLSLQEGDNNYLLDIFGTEPEGVREVFAKGRFPELWRELVNEELDELGIDLKAEIDRAQLDFDGQGFDNAETPWIVSQDLQPQNPNTTDRQNLFKFETLGDGDFSNTDIKVSIRNIRYASEVPGSNYGTFDVVVREFDDDDRNQDVVETFTGVNLNPQSSNYIAEVIGNRETVFTEEGKLRPKGEFQNQSDYIRVKVNSKLEEANSGGRDALSQLVPWGFDDYSIPLDFKSQIPHGLKTRDVQSVTDAEYDILTDGSLVPDTTTASDPFSNSIHFGVDFDWEGNETFFQAIAENADGSSEQAEFNQEFDWVLSDAYVEDPNSNGVRQIQYGDTSDEGFGVNRRKFTVAFQGGFDGKDPAKPQALGEDITSTNTQGFDLSSFDSPGTEAYERAIGILGNEDQYDINLLVTPGVINDLHSSVVNEGINMVEGRGDAFYVFDPTGVDGTISDATRSVQSIDTSYAATYYPWIRIQDNIRNQQIEVPPSVLIPRVYAFSDQTAAEWFAPAGFERGGVPEAVEAVVRLRREDRDELYANRVNPIAQFPDQGVSVWGQKTLQTQASALDRVNVRRLLIRVKKFIASTSRFLVFEQNVPETRNRFLNIVRPFLNEVQQQNGLFDFRVKMDAENNPPEVIDRNELVGDVFLQPTRTSEFLKISFNVLDTGAEFEDV